MMESEDIHANEVAKGTFWGLAGTIVTKLLAFLYTIYIAYSVSQGDIGIFSIALGIIAIITVWKDLGLPMALLRYVPYYEGKGEEGKALALLKYSYLIDAAAGLFLTAALFALSGFIALLYSNPPLGEALRLLSFFAIIDNLARISTNYLQGRAKIAQMQALNILQAFSKFALTVALVSILGANYASLCIAYVASYLIMLVASLPFVAKEAGIAKHYGEKNSLGMKEIISEIAPFGIMLMAVQTFYAIISSVDKAILGYALPASYASVQVAIYSMAASLGGNLMVLPAAVGGIFLPVISRLVGKGNLAQMRKAMGTAQRWVLFLTLPIAAVMIAFSEEMLSAFFGREYGSGGLAMAIFIAGLVFSVVSYTSNLALAAMRMVKLELGIVAFSALANIVLNIALIPAFGINGAALAGALGFFVSGMLFMHYVKKISGFDAGRHSWKLLAAGAVAFAFALAAKPAVAMAAQSMPTIGPQELKPYIAKISYLAILGIVSCLSFAAFGITSLILRCFGKEDIAVMKDVARKMRVPSWLEEAAEKVVGIGLDGKR